MTRIAIRSRIVLRKSWLAAALTLLVLGCIPGFGQQPSNATLFKAKAQQDQAQKNVAVVTGFWRDVWEGHNGSLVSKYIGPDFVEHNPNLQGATREKLAKMFGSKGDAPGNRVTATTLMTFTQGDLVILVQQREAPDPKEQSKTYKYAWLEMFRVDGGLIREHWDSATKPPLR